MYDIENLERQWRRYRRKQIAKSTAAVTVLLVLAVSVFFWINHHKADPKKVAAVSSANSSATVNEAHSESHPPSLSPEVPSMRNTPEGKKGLDFAFGDSEGSGQEDTRVKAPAPHIDIAVTKEDLPSTAKEIESRFYSDPRKDDALFLAQYYYKNKEYDKAVIWALETNKLDSNIEESWLIFGKAKAKLGKRMDAIRVLQAYYDRTGSVKAKGILDKIRRGKAF